MHWEYVWSLYCFTAFAAEDQMTYFAIPAGDIESFARTAWPAREDYTVEAAHGADKIKAIYRSIS